jgi:hypothetical protein
MDNIIENIICYFFQVQCNIKINHFQTLKYARHKATDELLDNLLELSDKFVEVYLGHYNTKPKFAEKYRIYITNIDDTNIITILEEFKKILIAFDNKLSKDTELLNIRDEMLAAINRTLYLFSLN